MFGKIICKVAEQLIVMRMHVSITRLLVVVFVISDAFLSPHTSYAQDKADELAYASAYLDHKTSALDKYLIRSERIKQRLLRRLKKKEERFLEKLAAKDSILYRQYMALPLTYDSIAVLSQDTAALSAKGNLRIGIIDSLKGIQQFIRKQSNQLPGAESLAAQGLAGGDYSAKISELRSKLNAEQQVKDLILQRTQSLEQMAGKAGIPGVQGIQKDIYYAQEKMKAWRELADDPDATEQKAMEYLQGVEGFDNFLVKKEHVFNGLGSSATAADLQGLGYQTKEQMNLLLQKQFGGNLQAVQQSMGSQMKEYSEKLNNIAGKVKESKQTLSEAKATKDHLKHIEKPAFKKNPERGKPFWQRLERQYNFQTMRASTDGLRPAMLELGASVSFKHTPKLSYGIGIAASLGLGQDWQHIRLSYEGVTARAYADWLLLYGFSVQAGYERAFRPDNRAYLQQNDSSNPQQPATSDNALKLAFGGQQQTAYIGIIKRYRINSKWSGTFLAGYNFLWQQSGLQSPLVIRFGVGK